MSDEKEALARRIEDARHQTEFLRRLNKERFEPASPANAPGGTSLGVPPDHTVTLSYGAGRVSPIQGGLIAGLSEDQWLYGGFWAQVVSSNVAAIAYDAEKMDLLVEFLNSSVYKYSHVPEQVARDFYRASSCGRFVHQRLKGRFGYLKVR